MNHHETIYLPIDFSDQYISCVKVDRHEQFLTLNYGFTNREGFTVSATCPIDFYRTVSDFESDGDKILVQIPDFLIAIQSQIEVLQKSG